MRYLTKKKIAIIHAVVLFSIISTNVNAQQVVLTFTGRDSVNNYVQLNRVAITNLTKSWQETIIWPDTMLTMQNSTSVEDYTENGGFSLSQNNPNPFSGTTDVSLTVCEEGLVNLDISDIKQLSLVIFNLIIYFVFSSFIYFIRIFSKLRAR